MRRTITAVCGLTLAAAVFSITSAAGQTPSKPGVNRAKPQQPLPVFSATDEATALGAVCGAMQPGSADRQITGLDQKETLPGYVSADKAFLHVMLLSASYRENGAARHVFVTGKYDLENGEVKESTGHTIGLCAGLLEHRGEQWAVVGQAAHLSETRQGADPPEVLLRQIGAARHAIETIETVFVRDGGLKVLKVYEAMEPAFREIVSINIAADGCDSARQCFSYRGKADYRPLAGSQVYDMRITLRGNYRTESGKIVAFPVSPFVLRFQDGAYQPATASAASRAIWNALTMPTPDGR